MRGIMLILLIFVHLGVHADSRWRCGSRVVASGDSDARVRAACATGAASSVRPDEHSPMSATTRSRAISFFAAVANGIALAKSEVYRDQYGRAYTIDQYGRSVWVR